MVDISRRSFSSVLLAAGAAIGIAGAAPTLALNVNDLAQQIAAAPSAGEIAAAVASARLQGMGDADIAQAFGRAYRLAELANASDSSKGTVLAAYESFKSTARIDVAALDAAFTVGAGRSLAAISGTAGAGGYRGSTTAVTTTNDNPSPH